MKALPMITEQLANLSVQQQAIQKQVGLSQPPAQEPRVSFTGLAGPLPKTKGIVPPLPHVQQGEDLDGERWEPVCEMEGEKDMSPVSCCKSAAGTKQGIVSPGCSFPCYRKRSFSRPFFFYTHHGRQGHCGKRATSARTSTRLWPIFSKGVPERQQFRQYRCVAVGLPRKVWRVRSKQRTWYGAVVARSRLRCHCQGRHGARKGPPCNDIGHGRAGSCRQQSLAVGMAGPSSGRPSAKLWISRGHTATGSKRPFAPMCPHSWTTTALAYIKEAELLNTKKAEILGGRKLRPTNQPPQSLRQNESQAKEEKVELPNKPVSLLHKHE